MNHDHDHDHGFQLVRQKNDRKSRTNGMGLHDILIVMFLVVSSQT